MVIEKESTMTSIYTSRGLFFVVVVFANETMEDTFSKKKHCKKHCSFLSEDNGGKE